MEWTNKELTTALKILSEHTSVKAACRELSFKFATNVDDTNLRELFKRRKLRRPVEYLGRPCEDTPITRRGNRLTIVWPDTHAPYHDPVAVALALKVVRTIKPDNLVVIGDLYDFYAVSFYGKNPRRRAILADEIAEADAEVVSSMAKLPVGETSFTCGNHEHRLDRHIQEKSPSLTGLVTDIREILPQKWEYHPYGTTVKIGKMHYSHDFGRHGISAGRQGLLDVGGNICFGHTHQLGVSYLGQQRGDAHVALNVGWLGGLQHIDYRHQATAKRLYMHGLGVVQEDARGNVWATAVPFIGRRCVVLGQEISL